MLTKKLLVRCRSRDAVENPDANDDVDMPLSKPDTPDGSSDAAGAWTTEVRQPMKLGHQCAAAPRAQPQLTLKRVRRHVGH